MGEDLQAMVDRMTINGGIGLTECAVKDVAEAIKDRLRLSNLGNHEYVQLAEQLMRLSVTKQEQQEQQQQQQQPLPQQRDAGCFRDFRRNGERDETDKEGSPTSAIMSQRAKVESVGVEKTWSTESMTSAEDHHQHLKAQEQQHSNGLNFGIGEGHHHNRSNSFQDRSTRSLGLEADNSGAPGQLRPPPVAQYSPMRRPRAVSRSGSSTRSRKIFASPRSKANNNTAGASTSSSSTATTNAFFHPFTNINPSKAPGSAATNNNTTAATDKIADFGPTLSPPPSVPRQPESSFNSIFGTKATAEPVPETERATISEQSPKPRRFPSVPAASPQRRAESPQPPMGGRATSPATTPSSPALNRPGLQENDHAGIAESPRLQRSRSFSPSRQPTPRREDDGAGAATAVPPRNFSPLQIPRGAKDDTDPLSTAAAMPSPDLPEISNQSLNGGEPMDLSESIQPDLFSPQNKDGGSMSINKSDKYNNRRNGCATPQESSSFSFSPSPVAPSASSSAAENNASKSVPNSDGASNHTRSSSNINDCSSNSTSEANFAAFDKAGLAQPSLSHSHVPRNVKPAPTTQTAAAADPPVSGPLSGFNADFNRVGFQMGKSAKSRRKIRGRRTNSSSAIPFTTTAAASNGNTPDTRTPPNRPDTTIAPPSGSSDSENNMDISPTSSSSNPTAAADPKMEFQLGIGGGSRKTKASSQRRPFAASAPTIIGINHSMSQEQVAPDYSELKNKISMLKDEARKSYMNGDYSASIRHYTLGIKMLSESPGRIQLSDTLAVLHSNRAAALMMIGAFEASVCDCEDGLTHITKNGEHFSNDGGPPLEIKLLTRLGRSLLKHGDHEAASKRFDDAVKTARAAIETSARLHDHTEHLKHKGLLEQMIAEASLGRSDAQRLREVMDKVSKAADNVMQQGPPGGRRGFADALGHVNAALSIASGSLDLYQANVSILGRMKRWREVAGFCERLAASNSRMGGAFVGDLEGKSPFPVSTEPQHLSPEFFGDAREEDAGTADLKLNSKAVAEAVFWLPSSIISAYLRALRLEERYPAADGCLAALESFVRNGNAKFPPSQLQSEFAWLKEERDKLNRTKNGREKGDELFRGGEFELAAAHYANCLNIDAEGSLDSLDGPNAGGRLHAVLHCNRAACLMAMKRHRIALEECSSALRIHSRYMKAMLRRARCYTRLSRFQEAISEYKRWLELVEEAKQTARQGSSGFVTPCLFDGPKDVKPEHMRDVNAELDAVYAAKRKGEAAAREENARRQESQQRWQNEFSSAGATWGDNDTARQRREQWQNQQHGGSRRWDSFRSQGPRSQSSDPRARSNSWRTDSSHGSANSRRQRSASEIPKDPSDHYFVLDVSVRASDEEIKKAYRKMALRFHPDKNKDPEAGDTFRRVQMAYEVLSDPAARIQYNSTKGYRRY